MVSYDDRYFDIADTFIKMEYGCIADVHVKAYPRRAEPSHRSGIMTVLNSCMGWHRYSLGCFLIFL